MRKFPLCKLYILIGHIETFNEGKEKYRKLCEYVEDRMQKLYIIRGPVI